MQKKHNQPHTRQLAVPMFWREYSNIYVLILLCKKKTSLCPFAHPFESKDRVKLVISNPAQRPRHCRIQDNFINPLLKWHGVPLNVVYSKTVHHQRMFPLYQTAIHSHKQPPPIDSQTFLHLPQPRRPRIPISSHCVLRLSDCVPDWPLDWLTAGVVSSYIRES